MERNLLENFCFCFHQILWEKKMIKQYAGLAITSSVVFSISDSEDLAINFKRMEKILNYQISKFGKNTDT